MLLKNETPEIESNDQKETVVFCDDIDPLGTIPKGFERLLHQFNENVKYVRRSRMAK